MNRIVRCLCYWFLRLMGESHEQVIWTLFRLDELEGENISDREASNIVNREAKQEPWKNPSVARVLKNYTWADRQW